MPSTHAQTRQISGIILSGGKSQRMGENKAFIPIAGKPIIQRITELFLTLFPETLVITNRSELYNHLGVAVFEDIFPERGALGGLYTGIYRARYPFSFVVGCDMPFLKPTVIVYLSALKEHYDVVVPRTPDGLQPLHAIYSKKCLRPIEELLQRGESRIFDFFSSVKVRTVSPEELFLIDPQLDSFLNLNTPSDLERLRRDERLL